MGIRFEAMTDPTARAARGNPAFSARAPYESVAPKGIRRVAAMTRSWKGVMYAGV